MTLKETIKYIRLKANEQKYYASFVKKKDVLHHNEVQIKGEKYVVQNESGCWWGIQKMTDYKRAEFLSSFCCVL